MSSHLVRLASFAKWPSTAAVSGVALARSGFQYTGHGEATVCMECQLVIDSWQSGDRPGEVHCQRSPHCAFVEQHLKDSVGSISRPPAAAVVRSSHINDVADRMQSLTTTDSVTASRVADMQVANHYPLPCSINREYPDFEQLKNEEARLSTFYDWPERAAHIVEPRDLAKAGMFYTGEADRVQCAFCRGYLRNWVQGDRPVDEHLRHFPDCLFVMQQKDVTDGQRTNLRAFSTVDFSAAPSDVNHIQFRSTAAYPRSALSQPSQPKHRYYAAEHRRVESFTGARIPQGQSVAVLAAAGFFHVGPEDNVRCYYCDGGLKNWQLTDEPWTEHRHWFPRCPHLQARQNGIHIAATQPASQNPAANRSSEARQPPVASAANKASQSNVEYRIEPREIKARLDSPMVQAVMKMGYSRDVVRKVIERRLVSTGDDFLNAHSLLEAVFALDEESNTKEQADGSQVTAAAVTDTVPVTSSATVPTNSAPGDIPAETVTNLAVKSHRDPETPALDFTDRTAPPKPKSKKKKKKSNKALAATTGTSGTDVNTNGASAAPTTSTVDVSSSVPTTDMLEENEKLREERTCKVCMDAELNTVFLPCGHFVCCMECAHQLQRCPVCRICISGTVRASVS